jgi:hypothetical protein
MLFTSQVTAWFAVLVTVAVNCCVVFPGTLTLDGDTVTTGGSAWIETVVEAVDAESAADTAVTVTVLGVGKAAGAVYRPAAEIVPVVEFPPVTPLTCQVTAVFVVFVTVAVNCNVAEMKTEGPEGDMDTPGAGRSVTVAFALSDVFAAAAAVMVTVVEEEATFALLRIAPDGNVLGAV